MAKSLVDIEMIKCDSFLDFSSISIWISIRIDSLIILIINAKSQFIFNIICILYEYGDICVKSHIHGWIRKRFAKTPQDGRFLWKKIGKVWMAMCLGVLIFKLVYFQYFKSWKQQSFHKSCVLLKKKNRRNIATYLKNADSISLF